MRRLTPLVAVLAVQPLAVLLPMADALAAQPPARAVQAARTAQAAPQPRPVAPTVTRFAVSGIDREALAAEGAAATTTSVSAAAGGPATDVLKVAVLTPARSTARFGVAGLTWTGRTPTGTVVSIRVHEQGAWGAWTPVPTADDGPDPGTTEAAHAVAGTDPLLTSGAADGVQVKVLTASGAAPAGMRLALVDPGTSPADGAVGAPDVSIASDLSIASANRPTILPRSAWGADESLRSGTPSYLTDVRAGVLHHTAGSNGYTAASVPGQLRGIYAYHTSVRGWSDIAYNVLVDRFGRAWEGRSGGVDRGVRGAHALGFNDGTFGVSAMGNFDTAQPSPAMLTTIARIFAWKFSLHRIDPRGTATLTSAGNLRFGAGARVMLPTMTAHRNVGPTACPGANLYSRMASLRAQVAARVGASLVKPGIGPWTVVHGDGGSVSVRSGLALNQAWKVTVTSGCGGAPLWSRSGTGRSVNVSWPLRTSSGAAVQPGTYVVALTSRTATSTATPYVIRVEVLPAPTSPLGTCPSYRLAARTPESVADGTRRVLGASRTLVVVPAEAAHRAESVSAGALARALAARLVSSPGGGISADVLARVRRDRVTQVYLVGTDGTWSGGVDGRLAAAGAAVTRIAGATPDDVLVAAARRAAQGRTVSTAMLVDPADPVTAAAASGLAASLGQVVLPAGPSGLTAAASAAVSDLGITDVVLAGTRGPGPGAVAALRATLEGVSDLRGGTADLALGRLANRATPTLRSTVVLVPVTGTDGLEAVLASSLGRPQLAVADGALAPVTSAWLRGRRGQFRRVSVAATPAQVSSTLLAAAGRTVGTTVSAAARPVATTVATPVAPAATTPPPVVVPTSFSVSGSGFGHGVGMSQYGAYALAQTGASYATILSTYYPGTALAPVDGGRHVSVNLLHSATRATFGVARMPGITGVVGLRLAGSVAGTPTATLGTADRATVKPAASGGIEVWRNGIRVVTSPGPVHVTWTGTVDWNGRAAMALLTGTGTEGTKSARPYRYGEMWVVRVGSRVEVVNELAIGRDYVRGLAEMPFGWGVKGMAALQAQSVAGRTFAWSKLLRGPSAACGGCHLYDSTRDQAFGGFGVELGTMGANWTRAVEATTHKIVTYRGLPAQTLYSSSTGGRTQDSRDVFGGAVPYLVSVADPYSLDASAHNPFRAWKRTVSQASMKAVFGLPDVVTVRVTARTAGSAAKSVTGTASDGRTVVLTGARFRSRLGLPANWVWSVTGS